MNYLIKIKKITDKMIYKSHSLLFGHRWNYGDTWVDKRGWLVQSCECGKKRLYNIITKEEIKL